MPVTSSNYSTGQSANVRWTGETGTGVPADMGIYSDITVQAVGTGTVTIEGSNDGTNWAALNTTAGEAVSLDATANAMAVLLEHPLFIRPVVAGGTATVMALGSGNR